MTIHFYTKETIERPASRQRAFLLAEEFRKRGVDAVVHGPAVETISETPWPKKGALIMGIVRSLRSIKKGDVVFLQRTVGNKYFFVIMVAYLKLFGRKMIFDFDDAIYQHSFLKTKVLTSMADAVFICSEVLRRWVLQYNSNPHVFHTTFGGDRYAAQDRGFSRSSGPITLGWIGRGEEHVQNLTLLAGALKLLKKRGVGFKFLLVGAWQDARIYGLFADMPEAELIDRVPWQDTPEMMRRFDIGLAPLVEKTEWNRARSVGKLFEYLAMGIASVSSRNGEPTNVITDGFDGFLADKEEEWADILERLIKDEDLRLRIARAGQDMFIAKESFEAIVPRMLEAIRKL